MPLQRTGYALGLTVFVVLVVLAAGLEALLPRRRRVVVGDEGGRDGVGENLSFALRSGLAPIRGYAEILGDRVGEEDRPMVRAIEYHAGRLTVLADRIDTERS
jgi:hypothetical protein